MRSRIKQSAMFCSVMVYRPRQSASTRPLGRHSFGLIWRCWRGPPSSRWRSSRCEGLRHTTCWFSSISAAERWTSPGSPSTRDPNEQWMQQMARNVTMQGCGALRYCRYLLHDRDTKYTISFRAIIESGRVKTLPLPARSPNLNAYAERWVRSVKEECLSKIIVFGERSLRRALNEYVAHYQAERNHQGESNVLLFRRVTQTRHEEPVQCRERLGGLLNYYHQEAA